MSVNSSNSVSIPATVLHQTDADMKKHEEKTNKVFFLPTCDSDLYKEVHIFYLQFILYYLCYKIRHYYVQLYSNFILC